MSAPLSAESLLRRLIGATDDVLDSILPGRVSAALPGTPEKVEAMTTRAWTTGKDGKDHLSGRALFHPDDLTLTDCLLLGLVHDGDPANGAAMKDAAATPGARVVDEAEARVEIDLEIVREKELRREATREKRRLAGRQAVEG